MEPSEISLLLLRHLARDGCVETIRAYMNECPALKQSLTVPGSGFQPDVEHFRQKLLNRTVNLNLTELLSEYARARSLIQDLVTKLLYEWNALSTLFLSPHDSMATQLAHITQLLETKCRRSQVDTKCIGTSDDPGIIPPYVNAAAALSSVEKVFADAETQTGEEPVEAAEDLPNIVSSLLEPPVLDKIVEIANKELNRSNQSMHENVLANDTETEIDKMLLDILHGIGGTPLPNNALNEGCNQTEMSQCEGGPAAGVEPQLMALFQDAQSIIVNTPIPGTLGRPEDSATKQKNFASFLDMIETPFKSAFMSHPSTPIPKPSTSSSVSVDIPADKVQTGLKTVELDFGPLSASSTSVTSSLISIAPAPVQIPLAKARTQSGPRYSIVQQSGCSRDQLNRLRRKRDITPRIPPTSRAKVVEAPPEIAPAQSSSLVRSASKRKFNTPMKLSPAKALISSVNFYCPSTSLQEKTGPSTPSSVRKTSSIDTPFKDVPSVEKTAGEVNGSLGIKSPLVTINYDDLLGTGGSGRNITSQSLSSVPEHPPLVVEKQLQITAPTQILSNDSSKTPDSRLDVREQQPAAEVAGRTPHMYSRLLASVRHSRPTTVVNKKSFSTPRKKGHIRNLMFKTPPGAPSERETCRGNAEDLALAVKRKHSPTPPRGSKSKKRLKWTNLIKTSNEGDGAEVTPTPPAECIIASVISAEPESVKKTLPLSNNISIEDVASNVIAQNFVNTRSRALATGMSNAQKPLKKVTEENEQREQSSKQLNLNDSKQPDISPPVTLGSRRKSKRMEDQMAAEAVAFSAIPLGIRSNAKERVTRSTRSSLRSSPEETRKEPTVNSYEVQNSEPIRRAPPSVLDLPDRVSPKVSSSVLSPNEPRDAEGKTVDTLGPCTRKTNQLQSNNTSLAESQNSGTHSQNLMSKQLAEPTPGPSQPRTRQSLAKAAVGLKTIEGSSGTVSARGSVETVSPAVESAPMMKKGGSSVRLTSLQISKAFPNLSSSLERSHGLSFSDSKQPEADTSVPSPSVTSVTLGNNSSPPRGRPRSPKKSPSRGPPRRILPKPVPPDYPRTVFPPPPSNAGYVLSIPSNTSTCDSADMFGSVTVVSAPAISPIPNALPTAVAKFPQLSSSDSSSEFGVSPVPKTPRLKADPGEESSMHTRLFGDNSCLGGPIFSSTPLKLGPPETPGKNIMNVLNNSEGKVLGENGDSRSSLFDTPVRVDKPPTVNIQAVMSTPTPKTPPRSSSAKIQESRKTPPKSSTAKAQESRKTPPRSSTGKFQGNTKTPPRSSSGNVQGSRKTPPMTSTEKVQGSRKTPPMTSTEKAQGSRKTPAMSSAEKVPESKKIPRKSKTPVKSQRKTPRKSSVPVKAAQKSSSKANFEFKPTKRTPYKSPLSKGIPAAGPTLHSKHDSSDADKIVPNIEGRKSDAMPKKSNINVDISAAETSATTPTISNNFLNACTKSKSFLRLSEVARRGRASLIASPTIPVTTVPVQSTIVKPSSSQAVQNTASPARTDSAVVSKENNGRVKVNKIPDVHFQFAVSGRAKELSLSETESLLGLLQIGTVKNQVKRNPPQEKKDSNVLGDLDVFKFLREVHASD